MGCCQGGVFDAESEFAIQLKSKLREKANELENDVNDRILKGIKESQALIEGELGDAVRTGLQRSATMINDQANLLRVGLQNSINAIQDINLKRRIADILAPNFRKFFVHSINCNVETKYEILEVIGQGSHSSVRRARHLTTNIERAVKIIVKSSVDENQTSMLINEVEALKTVDHPNIIKIIEVVEDVSKLCIVTELCSGGELFERILNHKSFDESTAASYMYQLLSGIIHIHKNGYIHCDLKPENILFLTPSEDSCLKIIDFGIARKRENISKKSNCSGTVRKM